MGYEVLIINLLLMLASVALSMSAAQKVTSLNHPEAGKLDVPTAEEGIPVSVVFGTVLIKKPNCVWYGDSKTTEIRSEASSGK